MEEALDPVHSTVDVVLALLCPLALVVLLIFPDSTAAALDLVSAPFSPGLHVRSMKEEAV